MIQLYDMGDVLEGIDPSWQNMTQPQRNTILSEAYEYKKFLECPHHIWHLNIDYGTVSLYCTVCHSDYWHVVPDYQDHLCTDAAAHDIHWERRSSGPTDRGEDYDEWLDISI